MRENDGQSGVKHLCRFIWRGMGIKPDLPNSLPSPSIVQNDDGAPLNIDRSSSSVMEETKRPGFQIPNTLQGNLTNVISLLSFHQSYKYTNIQIYP